MPNATQVHKSCLGTLDMEAVAHETTAPTSLTSAFLPSLHLVKLPL